MASKVLKEENVGTALPKAQIIKVSSAETAYLFAILLTNDVCIAHQRLLAQAVRRHYSRQ